VVEVADREDGLERREEGQVARRGPAARAARLDAAAQRGQRVRLVVALGVQGRLALLALRVVSTSKK
jgi:hypothetical protein